MQTNQTSYHNKAAAKENNLRSSKARLFLLFSHLQNPFSFVFSKTHAKLTQNAPMQCDAMRSCRRKLTWADLAYILVRQSVCRRSAIRRRTMQRRELCKRFQFLRATNNLITNKTCTSRKTQSSQRNATQRKCRNALTKSRDVINCLQEITRAYFKLFGAQFCCFSLLCLPACNSKSRFSWGKRASI